MKEQSMGPKFVAFSVDNFEDLTLRLTEYFNNMYKVVTINSVSMYTGRINHYVVMEKVYK